MDQINKLIIKHSVVFYSKAWKNRNKVIQSCRRHRECAVDEDKQLREEIEQGNKPSMRKCVRMQQLCLDKSNTGYIRLWNILTTKMIRNEKDEQVNSIRNYFSAKTKKAKH